VPAVVPAVVTARPCGTKACGKQEQLTPTYGIGRTDCSPAWGSSLRPAVAETGKMAQKRPSLKRPSSLRDRSKLSSSRAGSVPHTLW